jgi:hypothetical protein
MKAEIIKVTKQFTGDVYYKIEVDGSYVTGSTSFTLDEVQDKLTKCHLYKEEQKEVIKAVEL